MVDRMAESWRQSKLSCISIALCVAEIIVIWSGVILVNISGMHVTNLVVRVTGGVWLIGGLGSLVFAVAGLFADRDRIAPMIAIAATVVTSIACLLPMTM